MDSQNPRASKFHEDLESLQYVDPTPLPESRHGSISVPASNASPSSSIFGSVLGLSGSGHSPVYYRLLYPSSYHWNPANKHYAVTRLQKYSSYVFGVYASLHITNTSIIPLITRSVSASEPYLLLTRPFYQSFPLEPLLVSLPIATHILAGLALRIHRRNANLEYYGASSLPISKRLEKRLKVWPAVSWTSLSGYILAPLVIGHAFVNRALPLIYEGGSSGVGLGFVSHGFARHPVVSWVGYMALLGVAAGHFVWGAARWNGWLPHGSDKRAKKRWWTINGLGLALAGLWMAGGLGVVARGGKEGGWVGKGYDVLYSKIPLLKL